MRRSSSIVSSSKFINLKSFSSSLTHTRVPVPHTDEQDNNNKPSNAIDRILLRFRNLRSHDHDNEPTADNFLHREWLRPDETVFQLEKQPQEEEGDKEKVLMKKTIKKKKVKETLMYLTAAEATLGKDELRRLREMQQHPNDRNMRKISVPKAGLTHSVLQKIHHHWSNNELAKLKLNDPLTHNTNFVQHRTGGLVIWRSGSVMWVYRGKNYQKEGGHGKSNPLVWNHQQPQNLTAEEAEFNKMLDDFGPRFHDWWGTGILPVDADLLPPMLPAYKMPFRLLPAGMHPRLTNDEVTNLRKLAKALPCHFALGRNRNLQGLACAILKLWEKSLVAKIAVKRGIQNTNNELMAQELKNLTGGTLLLRNKFYIVLYRGKDFVPTSVAAVLAKRQEMTKQVQDVEEKECRASDMTRSGKDEATAQAGSLAKFYKAQAQWGSEVSTEEHEKKMKEAHKARNVRLIKNIDHKLAVVEANKIRADKILSKIEASMVPDGPDHERETITDEERIMLRAVGLRMKAYLQLGTHGVYNGVIENMHLHWRHRELVKLITKQKTLTFVEDTARLLEYETGGILVAIDRLPKGFSLIYYRGKSYRRPITLRPRNLLTKAKALQRSITMQRHEALHWHIAELGKEIEEMKKGTWSVNMEPEDRLCKEDQNPIDHISEFTQCEDEGSDVNDNDDIFDNTEDSDWDDLGPQIF